MTLWANIDWFRYAGHKSLRISVSIEIGLVFVGMIEVDLISVSGIDLLKWTKEVQASNPSQC